MADFLRPHLFLLAENAGWQRGKPMTKPVRTAVRNALRAYLSTNEGRTILEDAPRQGYMDRGEDKMRRMDVKDAADLLMEELDV